MEVLTAKRIGAHAYRYLTVKPRAGLVVSTFRRGLNVLFDEASEAGVVTFQSLDTSLHPWAVEVPLPDSLPDVGMPCATDAGSVRFDQALGIPLSAVYDARLHVQLDAADPVELTIKPYRASEHGRAQHRSSIIEQLLQAEDEPQEEDAFRAAIDAVLTRCAEDPAALLELIGLGTGLTPAGDDVLVGLLAADTALARFELRRQLGSVQLQTLTHTASAQMLQAALDGAFPEPLCELVASLGDDAADASGIRDLVQRVMALGASSGRMMLRGLLAALG